MKFLITGATGFIGQPLVQTLLDSGHAVNYLGRQRSKILDSRAAFWCWQTGEEPPLNCMGQLDAIVHLAGEPILQRWTEEARKRIWDSRIQGTELLVRAVSRLKHKPAALVSASAIGFYGDRGDEILTEKSPRGDGFLADLCSQWEAEALAAREFGVRVAAVRVGLVLGASGGTLKAIVPIFRAGLGGRLGNGGQWMSWIGLRDLIRVFVFAATNASVDGPVNGTSPQPVTNAEFTRTLANCLRRPAFFAVPAAALRLAYGELGSHILDSARVLPEGAERLGFRFEEPDLAQCLENILRGRAPEQAASAV